MAALIKQQHEAHIKKNPHSTFRIIQLPITHEDFAIADVHEAGIISIEMCVTCGYIQNTQCTHKFINGKSAHRWYKDQLLCMICQMDAEEFDSYDLIPSTEPGPCVFCKKPSSTVSLSFEAPLHQECTDKMWAEYWKANGR